MMAERPVSEVMQGNMSRSLARRPAIANGSTGPSQTGQLEGLSKLAGACSIEIGRILPDPDQPRQEFDSDALMRLAESMKVRGQLQPCRVRWVESESRYMIVVGERRWRAAMLAGLKSVECVVVSHAATPIDLLEDQIVENALRDDLRPVELAKAWRRLMDARGMSHRELAERLSVDHATVTRAMSLLKLPESIQESVDSGEIRPSTAYEISRVENPVEQAELAEQAKGGELKLQEIRTRVGRAKSAKSRGAKPKKKVTERTFRVTTGPKITVEYRKGLDASLIVAAIREALLMAEAELGDEQVAA